MKKLLILGVVALLALGGAGGLYATGMLDEVIGKRAAEAAAAVAGDQSYFVNLDPLTVPVTGDERLRSGVLLRVTLEVPDIATKNDVMQVLPRINDAILREFYARPAGRPDGSEFIDLEQATSRIGRIVDGVVGEGRVRGVLLEKAAPLS